MSDCALVADCYPETPAKDVDCYGFVVVAAVVSWLSFNDHGINVTACNYNEAAGSGQDHAITALDLGLSAKKAVKMAIKRNPSSGGKVRVFKVGDI